MSVSLYLSIIAHSFTINCFLGVNRAHDIADDRQQKTITSTHVLEAVRMLGWPDSQELYDFLKAKQTGKLDFYLSCYVIK